PVSRRQRGQGSPGDLRRRQGEGGGALQEGARDRSEVHRATDRSRSPVHHHGPLRGGAPGAPARDRRDRANVRCRLDREGSATRTTAPRVHQSQVAIAEVIRRLKRTATRWNPTALALIADRSRDPFRVLIACILSLRTQDTTTGPASERLLAVADPSHITLTISPCII